MTSKELIEKIKHIGVEEWRIAIEKIEKELKMLEKYACKYKSLISGKLWKDGKERNHCGHYQYESTVRKILWKCVGNDGGN